MTTSSAMRVSLLQFSSFHLGRGDYNTRNRAPSVAFTAIETRASVIIQPRDRRTRRHLLIFPVAAWISQLALSERILAEENAGSKEVQQEQSVFDGLKSLFDPDELTKLGRKLPKAYLKSARAVVSKLRDSLNGDSTNEAEFRRNADSAKEAIRDYVGNWRGSKQVASEESYRALEQALRTLGEFYSKKGPSATLPDYVKSRVSAALQTADENL